MTIEIKCGNPEVMTRNMRTLLRLAKNKKRREDYAVKKKTTKKQKVDRVAKEVINKRMPNAEFKDLVTANPENLTPRECVIKDVVDKLYRYANDDKCHSVARALAALCDAIDTGWDWQREVWLDHVKRRDWVTMVEYYVTNPILNDWKGAYEVRTFFVEAGIGNHPTTDLMQDEEIGYYRDEKMFSRWFGTPRKGDLRKGMYIALYTEPVNADKRFCHEAISRAREFQAAPVQLEGMTFKSAYAYNPKRDRFAKIEVDMVVPA
jgi:hypothetical protein